MTAPSPTPAAADAPTAARQAERRVQLTLWASGERAWAFDAASDRFCVDRLGNAADVAGFALDDQLCGAAEGMSMAQFIALVYPDDAPALRLVRRLHLRGAHADIDLTFRVADAVDGGRLRWLQVRGRALDRDARGLANRGLGTLEDVTAQHEAEDSLRLLAHAICSRRDAMALVDTQWTVPEIDEALLRLACADSGVMPGADLRLWLPTGDAVPARAQSDGDWCEALDLIATEVAMPVGVAITSVSASDGRHPCFLVAPHNLRERRQNRLRLQRKALVDKPTELPNRLAAQLHIDKVLLHAAPGFGLLFIDLVCPGGAGRVGRPQRPGVLRQLIRQRCPAPGAHDLPAAHRHRPPWLSLCGPAQGQCPGPAGGGRAADALEHRSLWPCLADRVHPAGRKVGLIQRMGRHAAHAAAQLAAASAALGYPLPVAVNLSPKQLLQPGLDSQLLQAGRRHGTAPSMLELELTESALVHNRDGVKPMLHRLCGHGFSLALDDFVAGRSSLSYLRHLPFDKIKIDRSSVMGIEREPAAARLLDSIVRLCQVLGMHTAVEGVETPRQALAAMGVNEFQGDHFSRPIPVGDRRQLLQDAGGQPPILALALPEAWVPDPRMAVTRA